jgi:hypothetical protein
MLRRIDRAGRSRRKETEMKGKLQVLGSATLLALAAASFGTSAALAGRDTSDAFMRAVNTHTQELSGPRQAPPDAFERALNASRALAAPSRPVPDAFERAVNGHTQALAARQTSFGDRGPDLVERVGSATFTVSSSDSGFDWAAAAVGGSAMLALVLVLSGGAVATRHTRSRAVTR